jgi:hypothetical protein
MGSAGADGAPGAQGPAGPAGPAGPQGPAGPAGITDGQNVVTFTGTMLNPGDVATHTIFNQPGWSATHLEIIALIHDVNSDTFSASLDGKYLWIRNWDNAPHKQALQELVGGERYSPSSPPSYDIQTINNGNDIQVQITQTTPFATNGVYTIICKWFTP